MNRIRPICLFNTKLSRYFHASNHLSGTIKPFLLADIGEGITDCEVIQWFVKQGDTVEEFDKICEVQSDKASVEISSRFSGKINKIHYKTNDMAKVGQPLVDIETEDDTEPSTTETNSVPVATTASLSNYQQSWLTPAVRRLISEYDLDVKGMIGSGKNGLVLKQDCLKYIHENSLKKVEKSQVSEHEHKPSTPIVSAKSSSAVPLTAIPLTATQKIMFKTMTDALSIPRLGYKDEIVLNAASQYRQVLNDYLQNQQLPFKKMSYLPILVKSLSISLSHYPLLNAQMITKGGQIQLQYRNAHHIGIAMDTPQGLAIPNIKHVEKKTVLEIAQELHRLTDLAKRSALSQSDLQGGTITLSNIGSIGSTFSNPVLVPHELAIVALGTARKLPRFDPKSNALVAAQILPVSWSADHRIIDGATIAQFGNTFKKFIENPTLIASELR